MTDDLSLEEGFKAGALYLVFSDGKRIEFSFENVRTFAGQYLDSPKHIPDHVRHAVDFQRCCVCPEAGEAGYCHALAPYLTIFDKVDKYPSYEQVQAFYLDPATNNLSFKKTSLQNALQYVSMLSVIDYCEFGRQYRDYFFMVTPLMKMADIAMRIYLNAFWLCGGDKEQTALRLRKFSGVLAITIDCQVKRLRLISRSDSVLNAFVLTHVLTGMLKEDMDKTLKEGFEQHKRQMM